MSTGILRSPALDQTRAPVVDAISVSPFRAVDFQLAVVESDS